MAAPPLSITLVTAPGPVGGLESVVASLASGLAGRGHRVRLAALFGLDPDDRCDAIGALAARGVTVMEIRTPPRHYRAEARRVASLLAGAPDTLLHGHGYHADIVTWMAARAAPRPRMSTVHGFTGGDLKNRVYEWLDRLVLRRFDAVVAVSRPLAGRLARSGVSTARLHVVPNAWVPGALPFPRDEARRRLGLPGGAPIVGWVGRLAPEKGPDVLLDALARLDPSVQGSFLGGGRLRDSLEARARGFGIAERVRWHGIVPEAGRLLSAFDVVALSSRTEGTPIILLEAMAAGVPVVATQVGGVPDVVPGGEALLVPPDAPDRLAAAIAECLASPELAAGRARAAQDRLAQSYAVEPWLDHYEAIYRSLACR